jgi:hypothetical protein
VLTKITVDYIILDVTLTDIHMIKYAYIIDYLEQCKISHICINKGIFEITSIFKGLFKQHVNSWNTSNVTGMFMMFHNAYAFNKTIGNWDMSYVIHKNHIFCGALSYNISFKSQLNPIRLFNIAQKYIVLK